MNDVSNNRADLTKDELKKSIRLWESAAISLIDIRHSLISPEEPLHCYRLPTSTFVYTSGAKAAVSLDNTSYPMARFGMFHGGKGTELSIKPLDNWLEYYMVLYKAGEPPFHRRAFIKLLEEANPFRQQYAFEPSNPLFISALLQKMFELWKLPTPLERFYGKSAFYQLVYEVYKELEKGGINVLQPDLIAMAKQYIDGNFKEGLSIQAIASNLGISESHLRRNFKAQYGESPQGYLTKLRLTASQKLLASTDYPIRIVASASGFPDEFYFSKLFYKNIGMSPSDYKAKYPSHMSDITMDNIIPFSYNEQSRVSGGKLKTKGDKFMFKQMRNKAVIAAAIALMLMLSACGNLPSNDTGDASPTSAISTQAPEEGTRTVKTVMGDVEVSMSPKRVIVQYLMGDLVALNITPIGISKVPEGAAFESEMADITVVGEWEFDPESVMALEPDLILLSSDSQYEDMSKIAPTVLIPYGSASMSTEKRLTFLGEILNRSDEAKAAIEKYENAVEQGKGQLSKAGFFDITVSAMQVTDNGNWVFGKKHGLGTVMYDVLGLKAPKIVQTDIIDADQYWGVPSMEVLSNYCGDYVFHLGEISDSISGNAVWQSIPAVKAGNILVMSTALTNSTDVVSSIALINNVVEQLLGAQNH